MQLAGLHRAMLNVSIALFAVGPAMANDRPGGAEIATAEGVQSMMDALFPPIDEAEFRSREERERIRGALATMISNGMVIDFNARVRDCDEQALFTCRIAYSDDPKQQAMVERYAVNFMEKLGLAGSEFGNLPLPQDARKKEGVDHWINWSQCYQPSSFPENAISCEKAYHPLSKPSAGVKAVFETRDGAVIAVHFYISDPRTIGYIRAERRRLASSR